MFEQLCSHSLNLREDTDDSITISSRRDSNYSSNNSSHLETTCNNTMPFPYPLVKKQRLENPKNVLIGHLNVNSLRNKFESVELLIKEHIDICLVAETKLDNSFPNQQFNISGYKLYRRDRNIFGGGLIFYINEIIPCKVLNINDLGDDIEVIAVEVSIKSRKWLIIGLYKPPSLSETYFLESLSKILNRFSSQYENTLLIGDFNLTVQNTNLEVFTSTFNLQCLIKKPTCF